MNGSDCGRSPEGIETLVTQRMRARRIMQVDLEDLVSLHLDPEVSRFIGGIRSPAETASYLQAQLDHWDNHGFGLWIFRSEDGGFLGRAGLRYVDFEGCRELEIAYTLSRTAWGRGIGTEIAGVLVDLWRNRFAENHLVGIVETGNLASERILLKVGFAHHRDALFHGATVGVFRRSRAEATAESA